MSQRYQHNSNMRGNYQQQGWRALQEENSRLNNLLKNEKEKSSRENKRVSDLEFELQETKAQLARQKALKEMYINKGKETKRELERVHKYTDEETLSTAKISDQVYCDIKRRKKKDLQRDYEELKVAFVLTDKKLQEEKDKTKALQEEVEQLKASSWEQNAKLEAETSSVSEEINAYKEKILQDHLLIQQLTAEKDNTAQELQSLQKISKHEKILLKMELETVQKSFEDLKTKNETEVLTLKQQVKTFEEEMCKEITTRSQTEVKHLETIAFLKMKNQELHQSITQQSGHLCGIEEENIFLKAELEKVQTSSEALRARFEIEILALKQQAKAFEDELSAEKSAHSQTENQLQERILNLETEKDQIQQNLSEELESELEQLKAQLKLSAEMEETPETISSSDPVEVAEITEEPTSKQKKKKTSCWRRIGRFLGLRKTKTV